MKREGDPFPRSLRYVVPGFLLLSMMFYAPHLLGFVRFPDGDFTEHFVPFALHLVRELRAKRLPVWNPYTFSGHPFLADVQAAVFYPPQAILALLTSAWQGVGARAYTLQIEAVIHLALAGAGAYLLTRALVRSTPAAWVSGIVFAFSGFLTGYPPLQLAILRTAVWLPWVLWGIYRAYISSARWGWGAAGVALSLAFLAGHPQTFLFLAYITAAWIGFLGWRAESRTRYFLAAIGMGMGVLGITAAQWLPSLEYTRLSVRAHLSLSDAGSGLPLIDTWQLILPDVLTLYSPLYVGIATLPLVALALWEGMRKGDPLQDDVRPASSHELSLRAGVGFFAAVGGVYLLIAYGSHTPFFPLLFRWAPGWGLFRGPERAAYGVALALSVLAGYGVPLFVRAREETRRRWAAAFLALIIVGVGGFTLGWVLPGRVKDITRGTYAMLAARTLILAAMTAFVWQVRTRRSRVRLLLLLLIFDLFLVNAPRNRVPGSAWSLSLTPPAVKAVRRAVAKVPGRVYNEYQVYPDYGMVVRVEDTWGSSPLHLARYARLFDAFPLARAWELLAVEHVLTWRKELFLPAHMLGTFARGDGKRVYLFRLKDRHPHAWLCPKVRHVNDDEAWHLLADFAFDIRKTALIPPEAGDAVPSAGEDSPWQPGDVRIWVVPMAPGHLTVHVRSAAGGMVVVSENWMPGWQGTIRGVTDENSRPVKVVRADLTLLGVPVPPGAWIIDLHYRPDSVRYGLVISLGTLGITLATGFVLLVRRGKEK